MGRSHTARMFHALQHVALLLTAYLVNAAGPPARGSNSPTCPGTVWNETLFSSSWGGVLPGDVANDVFPRDAVSSLPVPGYPLSPPPSCYHGAGHYVGWVSTNGFVRAFMVLYDVFVTIGEAKHGFWQWTQPGQDESVEFWWCQLGGNTNSTKYLSGHDDSSSTGGHTDILGTNSSTKSGSQETNPYGASCLQYECTATELRIYILNPTGSNNAGGWVSCPTSGGDVDPPDQNVFESGNKITCP